MAKPWKNYIDEHNEKASIWKKLRSSFQQFPETLIADIDAINPNDAGLSTLDFCVMKGCPNKGGKITISTWPQCTKQERLKRP